MKSMLNLLHKVQFFESFYRLDTLQNECFDSYFILNEKIVNS